MENSSTSGTDSSEPDTDGDGARHPADLARAALAGARGLARPLSRSSRRRRSPPAGTPTYSAAGADRRDPAPVGEVLSGLVSSRGWDRKLAERRLFADWPAIVGPDTAAHCQPTALRDGELSVTAESTAWATQLRLLSGTLLARLAAEVGPLVRTVRITGPSAPSWKHGPWSVRGRGPRDTYG